MKCEGCAFEGNHKSHFACDCCGAILCTSCGNYSSSEEKCFPLRERKVVILCPKCRAEMSSLVELMQRNRGLKQENERLTQKLSDESEMSEELQNVREENEKLAVLNAELKTEVKALKKQIETLHGDIDGKCANYTHEKAIVSTHPEEKMYVHNQENAGSLETVCEIMAEKLNKELNSRFQAFSEAFEQRFRNMEMSLSKTPSTSKAMTQSNDQRARGENIGGINVRSSQHKGEIGKEISGGETNNSVKTTLTKLRPVLPEGEQDRDMRSTTGRVNTVGGELRSRSRNVIGRKLISTSTQVQSGARSRLKAVERTRWLYVSNFDMSTTCDDILEVLKEERDLKYACEEVPSKSANPRVKSFKVGVPEYMEEVFRTPSFWPAGVLVNRFYFPKKTSDFQVDQAESLRT